MFRKKPEDVTKEERRMAKASNFTLIFGGGVNALVSNSILSGVPMSYPEATELKTLFYRSFPGVAEMISKAQLLSQRRVVQIALPNGAKRVLTGQNNRPTVIINTLIQGSAAVGFKYALHHLRYQNKLDYIGCVVHDELVAAVPEVEVKEYSDIMDKAMHKGMQVALPGMIVKTEVKVGRSWS
jgi:DNA polymerase I-like protein with 3'-5' exonuclease and polymerase domains